MIDRTPAPEGGSGFEPWLGDLVSVNLRGQIEEAISDGAALLRLVQHWSASTGTLIEVFEAGGRGLGVPDDVFHVVARLLGVTELIDVAVRISASCDVVVRVDGR